MWLGDILVDMPLWWGVSMWWYEPEEPKRKPLNITSG